MYVNVGARRLGAREAEDHWRGKLDVGRRARPAVAALRSGWHFDHVKHEMFKHVYFSLYQVYGLSFVGSDGCLSAVAARCSLEFGESERRTRNEIRLRGRVEAGSLSKAKTTKNAKHCSHSHKTS